MAPGPDGTVFVAVPHSGGSVLARLDRSGKPGPGWPIAVADSTTCDLVLPAEDGTVRVICSLKRPEGREIAPIGAFAFDALGRSLPGWPVLFRDDGMEGYLAARVIGDYLAIHAWAPNGDSDDEGQPLGDGRIITVAADGSVRRGKQVEHANDCCADTWAIGPDGTSYGSIQHLLDAQTAPTSSRFLAVSFEGLPPFFPIEIDGIASGPAFDADGRIHIIVNGGPDRHARTLVIETPGKVAPNDFPDLGFTATGDCTGIEGTCEVPAAPLVGPDGSAFVVGADFNKTIVANVWLTGEVHAGWPFRSGGGHQGTGFCPATDICEGYTLASPALGPDNVLYMIHRAANDSIGGSLVAILRYGQLAPGWPVELVRAGAEFWSVVVGSDGTAYALAIEPESGDASSATVLAIAPDSTVVWKRTIVTP
jgi:hypothetical protein